MDCYFDKLGRAITLMEWAALMQDLGYIRIGLSKLGHGPSKKRLSTVWMGLNHSLVDHGPPVIFESMLFQTVTWCELGSWRTSTVEDARATHWNLASRYRMNRRHWRRRSQRAPLANSP